jgi:asparagine N-glycosylation enzyme membrane subunit Stt3
MGERKTDQWVQFICFKTRITIGEELFQETWIPLAKALQARGINSVVLSQKVNAKDDSNDFVLISKTWWDAINAIQGAFPDGLRAASSSRPRDAIFREQVH